MIAFIAGVIIAFILSVLGPISSSMALILIILGLIVGIINIADKEVQLFLLAALVFMISATALMSLTSIIPVIGTTLKNFLGAIILFVAPSALVTSIKALYEVARNK